MKKQFGVFAIATLISISSLLPLASGCKNQELEISFIEPQHAYYVGDSINCYSFIEMEVGVSYEFSVQKVGAEDKKADKTTVQGQSYRADEVGEYTLFCKAKKDGKTGEGSVGFTVKEVEPFLLHYGTVKLPLGSRYRESILINNFNAVMISPTDAEAKLEKLVFYEGFGENSVTYTFNEGEKNEYFNGNVHILKDEGLYVYTLVYTNAGGSVSQDIKVEVREDFSSMVKLSEEYAVNYDSSTGEVTWSAVPDAIYYRVRIGDKIETVREGRSINVSKYLQSEVLSSMPLEVVAVKEGEIRIGKMTYAGMVMPHAYRNLVISGTTTLNVNNGEVTLQAEPSSWGRAASHLDYSENEYVGYQGEYGVGTYVDVEFMGNNMPIVRLFANDIDGWVTKYADTTTNGIILMSGFEGADGVEGTHAAQTENFRIFGDGMWGGYYETYFGENVSNFSSFVPTRNEKFWEQRKVADATNGGFKAMEHLAAYQYKDYPYLTMRGRAEQPNMKFKYTVGTRASEENTIIINVILCNYVDGDWVELYNIEFDTKLALDTYEAGNIALLAPFTDGAITFKPSQPYRK